MIQTLCNTLRGTLSLFLFCLNVLIFPIFILSFAGIVYLLPCKRWRHAGLRKLACAPFPWTVINSAIMNISNRKKWDIQLPDNMQRDKPYLVISNHQSWIDIMVIFKIFNWKIEPIKFFMKKELLWSLPMAGITCKAIGFPFMERHSSKDIKKNPSLKGKDIATTRASCQRLMTIPSSLMNFVEGTRYTQKKAEKQHSPYKHLLKPKAGGISIVIEEMHKHLAGIIDVSVYYDTKDMGFWNFCKGGFRRIYVRSRVLPITPDMIGDYHKNREFRVHLQQWLNTVWNDKDKLLDDLDQQCQNKH